jgi:hypothetical protein
MILQYEYLQHHPAVFRAMTGMSLREFEAIEAKLNSRFGEAEQRRLSRPERRRAIGGGRKYELGVRDQVLLTVVWLRVYPTHETLGYLFGVSDSTAGRYIGRVLPLLAAIGLAEMGPPKPTGGRGRRGRPLDELLRETPELAVLIDTFEQRIQRPSDRAEADTYYSGKKKQHTLKCQVAVDEITGEIVDMADSVPGPTADLTVLKESNLMERLPPAVGALGDLAYLGIRDLHPQGLAASPRRLRPRGKPRPAEDVAFNTAFARRRIKVEHTIGRLRCYQALSQTDRHHRRDHTARIRAVAGLVNHTMRCRFVH